MNLVETIDLQHRFQPHTVTLDGISLQIPEGSIYGFLGANGAGKTTTLRLLLGLLKKQHGEIKIFGKTLEQDRIDILRRTGSVIENPSVYEHLTATENLRILQKVYGCSKERIDEVLHLIGLAHTHNKTVKHFSLGMKQRLALGIAMLHKPGLLILDEPTNGLDPNGILEIRNLLTHLNQTHRVTVIISSHLLSEIEKVATHVGIIKTGKLMFQGTLAALLAQKQKTSAILLRTENNDDTIRLLQSRNHQAQMNDNMIQVSVSSPCEAAVINQWLVNQGILVFEIRPVNTDLESIFMELTHA